MADEARVTQHVAEIIALVPSEVRVTQHVIEFIAGLGIACNNPPNGQTGVAYTHTFAAGSGDPPYSFSITAGSFPLGLSLDSSTGIVSGSPSLVGAFAFTVTVTDAFLASSSVNCSITIAGVLVSLGGGGGAGAPPKVPACCDTYAVIAAEVLARFRARNRGVWPYPHVYPGNNSIPVEALDFTTAGAVGSVVEVLEYTVPHGFEFCMLGILGTLDGVNFNPGDATWTVDVNAPAGVPSVQGQPVQGLIRVPLPLGSRARGPWRFARSYDFPPLDVIRAKVTNVSLAPGALLVSGFFGYLLPARPIKLA